MIYGDGVFDVYKTVGLRLANGRIIYTDPTTPYTDNDKLTDFEEIGLTFNLEINKIENKLLSQYIGNGKTINVQYVMMRSDPTKDDTDNDEKLDHDDKTPWMYDIKKIKIYQSAKLMGEDDKGEPAEDLKSNDKTEEEILSMRPEMKWQLIGNAEVLFEDFKLLVKLVSMGGLQEVILEMIEHMKEGTGSAYSNEKLTEAAYNHKSTQTYVKLVKEKLIQVLANNSGNLNDLKYEDQTSYLYTWIQENTYRPIFKSKKDLFTGLTICVDDTEGNYIEIRDYKVEGTHFSGVMRFCIYDNFGLDAVDIEKYGYIAGFRAWYVLQHYKANTRSPIYGTPR